MNTQELLNTLAKCRPGDRLFNAVNLAMEVVTSSSVDEVALSLPYPKDALFDTYQFRLQRTHARGRQIIGLSESLEVLKGARGDIRVGYCVTEERTIVFWLDDTGAIVGCIHLTNVGTAAVGTDRGMS